MSESADRDGTDRDDDERTGGSPLPFMVALGVVVLVLIGIGLNALLNSDEQTDQDQVIRAAIGQNDALQRVDYKAYAGFTCPSLVGTADQLAARQKASVAAHGDRYVDGVNNIVVDGDRATATVVYFFGDDRSKKVDTATTFERHDGHWQVCTAS